MEDFKQALETGGLELCFLPQVGFATGQIVGLQTLVRWSHPHRGRLEQNDFLPIIEKTGVATVLAKWLIENACAQLSAWRDAEIAPRILSIGMSHGELRAGDEIFSAVREALERWRLKPSDLEVDVTESTLVQLALARNDVLSRLHEFGVAVGVNELGAQCSSFDYLKRHLVDRIIVPQPLAESTDDPIDSAISRAIMALSRELDIEIVSSGAQTKAQGDFAALPESDAERRRRGIPMSVESATLLLQGTVP